MILFLLGVITISLSGVMLPGPMLAMTVARSYRSPYTGALVSLGHLAVELPLILLLYFGLAAFLGLTWFRFAAGLLGGLFLLYLSFNMFRARARKLERRTDPGHHSFVAGIATTLFNPLFILWWLVIGAALLLTAAPYGIAGLILLIAVHWLCDFAWLAGVSVTVNRTKHLWGARAHSAVFVLCSLLLSGFGVWFLWSAFRLLADYARG